MENKYLEEYENCYRLNEATLEEVCEQHTPGFLFFASECDPSKFAGSMYPWHWHAYVQFFYVKEGELTYRTPGGEFHFHPGEAGFINANVLHMMAAKPGVKTRYMEYLFYPSMIGSTHRGDIMNKYVHPITKNAGFEGIIFGEDTRDDCDVRQLLIEIYELFAEKSECYELLIQAKLSLLWACLFRLSADERSRKEAKPTSSRLRSMILYINEHSAEKITLEDIAAAGICSRRECSRVFQHDLHTTPFQYLMEVRINKATQMLTETDEPVTGISEICGFSDPSHFSRIFREKSGMTPREFRNRIRGTSL